MKKNKAFTMFEISLVFAIVTVIVAVSIRITKAKFDSLNRYLYYGAYSMLKSTMKEILYDMNQPEGSRKYEKIPGQTYTYNPDEQEGGVHSLYKICGPVTYFLNIKSSNCNQNVNTETYTSQLGSDDFSTNPQPSVVLSNGMKIYNLDGTNSNDTNLLGTGFTYTDMNGAPKRNAEDTANLEAVGFVVYVDIDGERGNSKLWDDIFPFYVVADTADVIPAWKNPYGSTPSQPSGAKDDVIVKAGIYNNARNQYINAQRGLTFQEAICRSGVIVNTSASTDYCEGITVINDCNKSTATDSDPHDCIVKVLPPIKV